MLNHWLALPCTLLCARDSSSLSLLNNAQADLTPLTPERWSQTATVYLLSRAEDSWRLYLGFFQSRRWYLVSVWEEAALWLSCGSHMPYVVPQAKDGPIGAQIVCLQEKVMPWYGPLTFSTHLALTCFPLSGENKYKRSNTFIFILKDVKLQLRGHKYQEMYSHANSSVMLNAPQFASMLTMIILACWC